MPDLVTYNQIWHQHEICIDRVFQLMKTLTNYKSLAIPPALHYNNHDLLLD